MIELVDSLLKMLAGAVGALGIIAIILALNPDKVEIWASWLFRGARLFTRRAEYGYIAHDIAGHVNDHIQKHLVPQVQGLSATGITVRWHNSADTIVHEAEGTVFVRMRPHEERLANIFHATLAAAPRLVAPTLRTQIALNDSKAIDIQLCRRLAERISQSAMVSFRLNVIEPALKSEPLLEPILSSFQALELGGLFVPVFIQELVKVGGANPIDNLEGIDAEVRGFYTFLREIAEKPRGTDVNLAFLSKYIRVHILLVAKAETKAAGIDPYRWRVGRSLAQGAETIYVLASGTNIPFAEEVVSCLDSDFRLSKGTLVRSVVTRESNPTPAMLVPFERNAEFFQANPMHLFSDTEGIIAKGTRAMATVVDVQPSFVTIDLKGIQAFIPATDLSWEYVRDCNHYAKVDEKFEVEVTGADPNSLEVYASRKACLPKMVDSLSDDQIVGQVLNVHVKGHEGQRFCFGVIENLGPSPVRIYEDEVEWGDMENPLKRVQPGQRFTALGLAVDRERGFIVASKKRLLADRWDDIRRKYPHGKLITVTVLTIAKVGAICEVESGLCGLVPESEFMLAGLEYRNFRTNLKPGHQLYVSVGRVVSGKRQRLSLCLQRNTLQGDSR